MSSLTDREQLTLKRNQKLFKSKRDTFVLMSEKAPYTTIHSFSGNRFTYYRIEKKGIDYTVFFSIMERRKTDSYLAYELEELTISYSEREKLFYPAKIAEIATDFKMSTVLINSFDAGLFDYNNQIFRVGAGTFDKLIQDSIKLFTVSPKRLTKYFLKLHY